MRRQANDQVEHPTGPGTYQLRRPTSARRSPSARRRPTAPAPLERIGTINEVDLGSDHGRAGVEKRTRPRSRQAAAHAGEDDTGASTWPLWTEPAGGRDANKGTTDRSVQKVSVQATTKWPPAGYGGDPATATAEAISVHKISTFGRPRRPYPVALAAALLHGPREPLVTSRRLQCPGASDRSAGVSTVFSNVADRGSTASMSIPMPSRSVTNSQATPAPAASESAAATTIVGLCAIEIRDPPSGEAAPRGPARSGSRCRCPPRYTSGGSRRSPAASGAGGRPPSRRPDRAATARDRARSAPPSSSDDSYWLR